MRISDNKKKRILVVGYLPPPYEGTAKMTQIIMDSVFLRKSFNMHLMSMRKDVNIAEKGRISLKSIRNNILNVLEYFFLLFYFRPKVVYMSLAQNISGFLRDSIFIRLGKLSGKKVCVHFHGAGFENFVKTCRGAFAGYIFGTLGKIDHLILLANKFKVQFSPFMEAEKMSVLYNSINIPVVQCPKKCPKRDMHNVLFIGQLSVAKGAVDVVRAADIVINKHRIKARFILCGSPVDIERNIVFLPDPHRACDKIEKIIEDAHLDQYIEIHKRLSGEEKDRLFIGSDMFVFPSYYEGCGLVVLEAMSYGLPIIATDSGALEEMLKEGENCFFISPGDIQNLADKIVRLVRDPGLRERMGSKNIELIRSRYNADNYASGISDIWKGI